eukprot:Tamp_16349.p1 GENE.Tamp_16349~~Tamp_16349.p1  ORF type:complete len:378 (-),score=87.61 Tamp_16349:336-1439(-)
MPDEPTAGSHQGGAPEETRRQPNVPEQAAGAADSRSRHTGGTPGDAGPQGGDKEAYVTLVTTSKYLIGAEVLAKSLRAFHASRPLLALVDSSLPEHVATRLEEAGWGIKYIHHVENRNKRKLQDRPWFNTTFSKLHVFGLHEYDKIVYLDADLLLLANIDELFNKLPRPAPGSADVQHMHDAPFAAASEVFPPDTFNSGVLVIRPRQDLFEWLLDRSEEVPSYDGSDQGFLNTVFSSWWQLPIAHRLAFKYNVPQTLAMYYPPAWEEMISAQSTSILHFAGDDSMKPWSFSGVVPASLARYVHLWQDIARAPLGADVSPLYHKAFLQERDLARAQDDDALSQGAGEREIEQVLSNFKASQDQVRDLL